ncbi:AraC family transcriptional regulator [Alkalihalobacillus xiaoxiensis]|uniref:AraC family transcriptional regulator n=1 Tax=Shouchella xiaoxiensis TaxID=766895 RepID=A0ABS2SWD7_9BACI|nr:AraC family transcriptional regulator [Shouchella xiaoxiensis]MBM7839845.1 AraC family transcriptional regulator [Shouchella xiaoxiensis]
MDSLDSLNEAIAYIEANLDQEIDYSEVAKVACFSEHHFKRMFSFIAGIPLSEYVRRRRLTLAAFDLKEREMRVIDVAIKYGYHSPDAFARAFQALHGILPKKVKGLNVPLKAYPRMTFQLSIKGDVEMNYRFVEKEAFRIIGKKENVLVDKNGFNPQLWDSLEEIEASMVPDREASFQQIVHVATAKKSGEVDYYIAVESTKPCPPGFDEHVIPANTWAVFTATGELPEALLTTWERIYSEWFPTSGYELADAPEFTTNVTETTNEIWVPVMKAAR